MDVHLALEITQTVASLALPFVLIWAGHQFQRRQKSFEAVMGEKARHYAAISPLLNLIFAYRYRVGDFLDRAPETVLDAKRRADHEFWTFEYLWSDVFRRAYHAFMTDGFRVFNEEGSKAVIRVDGGLYRVKPADPGWPGFTGEPADRDRLRGLYAGLKAAIARDLGFRHYAPQVGGPFSVDPRSGPPA